MVKYFVLTTLILTQTSLLYSQPIPQIEWIRAYDGGDSANDSFEDVYALPQGGFVVAGYANSPDIHRTFTSLIAKVNEQGDFVWSRQYEAGKLFSIIEADNHDLVAGGLGGGGGVNNQWFEAYRVDVDGELIWNHRYSNGWINAVIELKNGDFLLGGTLYDEPPHQYSAIVRINADGDAIWTETYREDFQRNPIMAITGMRETDGGVVAGGYIDTPVGQVGSTFNFWILKINLDGERIWSHALPNGENTYSMGGNMTSTRDGGFVFGGQGGGARNEPGRQAIVMKVNSNGEEVWFNRFNRNDAGGPLSYQQNGRGILCQTSRELVICGSQFYINANEHRYEALLIKTSPEGVERWRFLSQFYNVAGFLDGPTDFRSVVQAQDRELVACGYATRLMLRNDAIIVKFAAEEPGNVIFYYLPEDTIFSILPGESVEFTFRAMNRYHEELNRDWYFNDSLFAQADTYRVVRFDDVELDTITCRFRDLDWENQVRWYVNVCSLYTYAWFPDTLALALRRGTSQTFSLDTVRAVEGDPVEYHWTLTNLDNFEREETGAGASATIEFLRSGNYQMEGLAYRGESSDNVIWTIAVRSAILDFWPRELNLSVLPDSLVNFGVLPFNPDSDSLSYAWFLDGELIGQDSVVGWWFAPLDSQAGRSTYAVNAIVMDGMEGDTVRWTVSVRDPNATPPTPPSIEAGENPTTFGITSVSPNPFNSMTTIRYMTSGDAYPTRLTVHDLTGREVARLVDERDQQSPPSRGGLYAVRWEASELPAGIYLVRLESGRICRTAKILLVR